MAPTKRRGPVEADAESDDAENDSASSQSSTVGGFVLCTTCHTNQDSA